MLFFTLAATTVSLWFWRSGACTPYPKWWKLLCVSSVAATLFFGLYPPLAGTITDAVVASRADTAAVVPVLMRSLNENSWTDARDNRFVIHLQNAPIIAESDAQSSFVVLLKRNQSDRVFTAIDIVAVDPWITMPYIVGLAERGRLLFFHVPLSWVATIAYMIAMYFGIRYLRTGNLDYDRSAFAMISVATLYGILATLTGAVWARFNWGSYWNWDPKQTAIFLVLMMYAAYFLLRSSISDQQRRARLSAAYSIVGSVVVPFLFFVLPRLMPGLHPGSSDDVNAGPLLSLSSDSLNPTKQWIFGLSLFAFTMLFFWLVNIRFRITKLMDSVTSSRL